MEFGPRPKRECHLYMVKWVTLLKPEYMALDKIKNEIETQIEISLRESISS
jgi:hypothetical protein